MSNLRDRVSNIANFGTGLGRLGGLIYSANTTPQSKQQPNYTQQQISDFYAQNAV